MIDDKIILGKINRIKAAFKTAFNISSDRIIVALTKEEEDVAQDMVQKIQNYYNQHKSEIQDPNKSPQVYTKFIDWLKSVKTQVENPSQDSSAQPAAPSVQGNPPPTGDQKTTASVKRAYNKDAIIDKVKGDLRQKDQGAYNFFFKTPEQAAPAESSQIENAADASQLNLDGLKPDLNQTEGKNPANTSQNPFGAESFASTDLKFTSEVDGVVFAHALDPAKQFLSTSSNEISSFVSSFLSSKFDTTSEWLFKAANNKDYWDKVSKNPDAAVEAVIGAMGRDYPTFLENFGKRIISSVNKYKSILSGAASNPDQVNTSIAAYAKKIMEIVSVILDKFVNRIESRVDKTKSGGFHFIFDSFKTRILEDLKNSFIKNKAAGISEELAKSIYASFDAQFKEVYTNLDKAYDLELVVKAITNSSNARYNAILAKHVIATYAPELYEQEQLGQEDNDLVNQDLVDGFFCGDEKVDETNVEEKVEELSHENQLLNEIIQNKYLTEEYLKVMQDGISNNPKIITGDEGIIEQVTQAGVQLLTKLFSDISKEELNEVFADLSSVQTICQYLNAEIGKIDKRFSMSELSINPNNEIKVIWNKKYSGDIINNYYTGTAPEGSAEAPKAGEPAESSETPAEPPPAEASEPGEPEQLDFPQSESNEKTEAEQVFTT
jgi:hypothetical protein